MPAGRDRGAAGELGDGGPVLLARHDPGGQVVAVEQLVFAAQQVVLAVAPGRLGVGAVAGAARRGPGEGLQVRPVHGQRGAGVLELVRDGCLQQVVADRLQLRRGQPVRLVLAERVRDQAEGVLGLPVGQQVRAVLPVRESRRAAAGRLPAARSAPGAPGSGGRAARRPGSGTCPASRVRTLSCRARTPAGSMASIRGAAPEASMTSSERRQRDHRRAAPEQPDRLGLAGRLQPGDQVAEPLGAADPGCVHERGQPELLRAVGQPGRAQPGGVQPGQARPRRPAR